MVESPFGFHVLRLTDIHPEEMMRSQVKDKMVSDRFGAEMQKLVEQAVSKAQFVQSCSNGRGEGSGFGATG